MSVREILFKKELDRGCVRVGELTNTAMERFFTRSLVNNRQAELKQVMGVAMNVNTSFVTSLHLGDAAVSTGKLSSRKHITACA